MMKNILTGGTILLMTLGALGMSSCTDNLCDEVMSQTKGNRLVVKAHSGSSDTRVELGQDGLTTLWQPGDQLVLVQKTPGSVPIYLSSDIEEPAKSANFTSEGGVPVGEYWVIYNYNADRTYSNQIFKTIDEINSNKSLALYGEINVTAETTEVDVEMKHMYAQITIEMKNVPSDIHYYDQVVGLYCNGIGFSPAKIFTASGLENASYGYRTGLYGSTEMGYIPSDQKYHNLLLGTLRTDNYDEQISFKKSALIFETDLADEDVYFYVLCSYDYDQSTCYEFKKQNINIKAGKRYTVVLDFNDDENVVKTTVNITREINNEMTQSVYHVENAEQWRHMAYKNTNNYTSNDYIKIDGDIDFNDKPFFPLSSNNINGNNHKLSNITLNRPNDDNVGLHKLEWRCYYTNTPDNRNPQIDICSIYDLTLENVNIIGKNYVGSFGGMNVKACNCKVIGSSTITGSGDYVGGIVGFQNYSSSYDVNLNKVSLGQGCKVQGVNYVGGIAGAYGTISSQYIHISSSLNWLKECVSSASIISTGNFAGGIFGAMGCDIFGTSDYTTFEFNQEDKDFSLIKCYNYGDVTGKNFVGGIGGALNIYTNSSDIDKVVIKQSLNEGTVTGEQNVGGILGSSMASINTCYSREGTVVGVANVGGILGAFKDYMGSPRVANCYSLSDVISEGNNVAGIVGYALNQPISYSYYAGKCTSGYGILGSEPNCQMYSYYSSITGCLTTTEYLFNPAEGEYSYERWNDQTYNHETVVERVSHKVDATSLANVTSILSNRAVINGDNAYGENTWSGYPYECVKFSSFSASTSIDDFTEETIN